jgi:uncharacterized RDD family membrane protein YckC
MGCPQCQSKEISASGVCPVCGYVTSTDTPAPESEPDSTETRAVSSGIEIDYSEDARKPEQQEDRPQWRRDLAQRLQAIKEKREAKAAREPSKRSGSQEKRLSVAVPRPKESRPQVIASATFLEGAPVPRPVQRPRSPVPKQKILQPLSHETPVAGPSVPAPEARDVQTLIDNAVSGKALQADTSRLATGLFGTDPDASSDDEGKLILLSRTLSGLVDLIVVSICSGVCILAADFVSGIIELDAISYLAFTILFLLIYFLYSLFFLTAAGQTIGMMITDLRVINAHEGRPSLRQLLCRCGGYLVSLFGLGFGLIWSLFNRENLCFHDHISGTQVIRA